MKRITTTQHSAGWTRITKFQLILRNIDPPGPILVVKLRVLFRTINKRLAHQVQK